MAVIVDDQFMQFVFLVVVDVELSYCFMAKKLETTQYAIRSVLYKESSLRENYGYTWNVLSESDRTDSRDVLPVHSEKYQKIQAIIFQTLHRNNQFVHFSLIMNCCIRISE